MKRIWVKRVLAAAITAAVISSTGSITSFAVDVPEEGRLAEDETTEEPQEFAALDIVNAGWSDWSEQMPQALDGRMIESKTEYRYKEKSETTSTDASLAGWTRYKAEPETWSDWSDYQDGYIADSDAVQVQTRQVVDHYNYTMGHYCTGNVTGARYQTCYTNTTQNSTFNSTCVYHSLGTFTSLNDFYEFTTDLGVQDYLYKGTSKDTAYRCANTCYRWYVMNRSSSYKTQYSSRRVTAYTYYYYKWSDWSEWSTQAQTPGDTRQVESRTLYRYQDIEGTLGQCEIRLSQTSYVYDGNAKTPEVTVIDPAGKALTENVDYAVNYLNNVDAGKAAVSIVGKTAQTTGAKTLDFVIDKAQAVAAFAERRVAKRANKVPFNNPLTTNSDGQITYESANRSVAAVNAATGEVTPLSKGNATITARIGEGKNYTSATASYELEVADYSVATLDSLSFKFKNFTGALSQQAFINIYGDTVYARNLYKNYSGTAEGGTCYGMSSASGMFNVPSSGVGAKDFGRAAVKNLELSDRSGSLGMDLKLFIQSMFTSQLSSKVQSCYSYRKSLSEAGNLADQAEQGGEPVLIAIFGPEGGHAVVGYRLDQVNATTDRLYIYDCNYPNTQKYITLTKKNNVYTGWSYKIGAGFQTWNQSNGDFSYVPYEVYAGMWTDRPKSTSIRDIAASAIGTELDTNTYLVNAAQFEVQDAGGEVVASYQDGILTSEREDIFQFRPVDILDDQTSAAGKPDEQKAIIYMPTDTYTLVNKDSNVFDFEITSINQNQSSTITTTADKVTIALSDAQKENKVIVESDAIDVYTASFDSSLTDSGEIQTLKAEGIVEDNEAGVAIGFAKNTEFKQTNLLGDDATIKKKADIKDFRVELDYTEVKADGKAKKPKATVYNEQNKALKENLDYIVKYINNVEAGTASLKIYGVNQYTGSTKPQEFRIVGVDASNESIAQPKKLAGTKKVTVKKASKGIKVTWKKVKAAKKYVIYRKYGKNGKWKKLTTTKKLTYTDKKVKKNKKCYYAVQAVDGSMKSDYVSSKVIRR